MLGRDPIHEGPLLEARAALRTAPGSSSEPADALPADDGPRRRRRRRWLGGVFLVALSAFLALTWSAAVAGRGQPTALLAGRLRAAVEALRGPPRIGLQVGHLEEAAVPPELAKLRTSTGASVDGLEEVNVNHAIVRALAARLRRDGFRVDVFGATVPVRYHADLVLAVHADANANPDREGYKSAHFVPLRNARDPLLKLDVDRAVLAESRLGDDQGNVSIDMRKYYAFNNRRFRHALARRTPGLIVEMGYLSNAYDRSYLEHPSRAAQALADGVVKYLQDVGRIPAAPIATAGATP